MISPMKRVGRPRDQSVEPAVVQAVFDLLQEVGVGALSMDAIAARAGVSKATIYRRWESKEDLVIDCVAGLTNAIQPEETHDIRTVLVTLLKRLRAFMSDSEGGSIFPWLVGEVSSGTELGRHYAEAVILPRRKTVAALISAARDRGELRADLDIEVAVDMLTGPAILRKLMGTFRAPDEQWEEKLVDSLLAGWRPG